MAHHQAEFENDAEIKLSTVDKVEVHWTVMPYAFGTEPNGPYRSDER